jgi:hypothetical protein
MLIALSTWAQKDSSATAMDDILLKLNKLEELKGANDTVSSLKVITDTMYAQSVEPIQASVEDSNVLKAQIIFDTATYDMGSITQGEIAKQRFEFVNTGTQDLFITDVVADCSCTSPDWTKGDIKPGQKGYVIATYDSKEDVGKFMKTITVLHNSGAGYTFLEISGFVAPKL